MKETFAIFVKDTRHFWPEILVSTSFLLAFVLVYPHQWRSTDETVSYAFGRSFPGGGAIGFLAGCLVVLVPIAWWILVARVVHGERLVGNTQFWLTRPYEWPKLLAAKALFLSVFIVFPFFVVQCILLVEGGFHPTSYLPGLFYNLMLVTGVLVLPLGALAVVTSGFARMVLVVLGVILFIAGAALLGSLLPSDTTGSVASSLGDKLSFGVLVSGCAAVILAQYARRKLRMAWVFLAIAAMSLAALGLTDPDQMLMGRNYEAPAGNSQAPVEMIYAADTSHQPVTNDTRDKSELEISVPLRASGVAEGSAVMPAAVKAIIEAADGARWESPWNVIYNERYLSGSTDSVIRFRIPRSIYERFKPKPSTLRLKFALDLGRATNVQNIALTSNEFVVPGFGICTPQSTRFNLPPEITQIGCRSAMHSPHLTYVTAHWTEGECSRGKSFLAAAWEGSFDSDPADFGITSVWTFPLALSNSLAGYNQGTIRARQLCPGSLVTFTSFELEGHTQIEVSVPNFQLPELALGDLYLLRMK